MNSHRELGQIRAMRSRGVLAGPVLRLRSTFDRREAARSSPAPRLDLSLTAEGDHLWIESSRSVFGPAPFVAVEETNGLVYRNNSTTEGETLWCYQSDSPAVRRIGVGAAASDDAPCLAGGQSGRR